MALYPHSVPDLLDSAVGADQKSAAHDSFENPAHELLRAPHAVCFDHFVGWVAKQRKIKLLLFLEVRKSFFRVGAHAQDRHILFIKALLCVAKLGRFCRSTRCVGLRKEKKYHALSLEILQRNQLARVALQRKVRRSVCDFQHILCAQLPRSFFSISFTVCGFAWPRVALITCPTKNLKTPSLPDLNLATFSGFFSMTSRAICSIESLLTCAPSPSASTICVAPPPVSTIFAKTFLPTAAVILPLSTSFINSDNPAAETGLSVIPLPLSFKRRRSSVCIQLAAAFPEDPALTTASK